MAGDTDLEDFVRARGDDLRRLAYLLTGNAADAEDLVQTVLARVLPRWSRIVGKDDPYAYVRTALVNTRRSWWRRDRQAPVAMAELPERDGDGDGDDDYAGHDGWDEMRRALVKLPAGQRKVLVLRYYEDLSEAEIARLLGCSQGTVKSQASRGIVALRGHVAAGRSADTTFNGSER